VTTDEVHPLGGGHCGEVNRRRAEVAVVVPRGRTKELEQEVSALGERECVEFVGEQPGIDERRGEGVVAAEGYRAT
jgi:hypothetical protein